MTKKVLSADAPHLGTLSMEQQVMFQGKRCLIPDHRAYEDKHEVENHCELCTVQPPSLMDILLQAMLSPTFWTVRSALV